MNDDSIIIEIGGGLGNQMFQYALYLKLSAIGKDCSLYYDEENFIHSGPQLNQAFGIKLQFRDKSDIELIKKNSRSLKCRLLSKLAGVSMIYWEHNKGYAFKPSIFKSKGPCYLQGCWLSENYFKDVENLVRNRFQFININERTTQLANEIGHRHSSVSIHMRQGDYLKSGIHKKINYASYLNTALNKINEFACENYFYVFSDDKLFAARIMQELGIMQDTFTIVDWNSGKDSYNDMFLMSLCKHNIIANSTFSWWGAWLNKNRNKQIVSPEEWFVDPFLNENSIIPPGWLTVSVN